MLNISLIQSIIAVLRSGSAHECPQSSDHSEQTINCWGSQPEFAQPKTEYDNIQLFNFYNQNLKNAIAEKLRITGAKDVLSELGSSLSIASNEIVVEKFGENHSLVDDVGKNNVANKPAYGDNHDWESGRSDFCGPLGYVHFSLIKLEGTSVPTKWVFNIVVRIKFDFSELAEDAEFILDRTYNLKELFQDDRARQLFMATYARWGQLAWHGWRFATDDTTDELYVFVWPKIWDNTGLKWKDPNTPLNILGSVFDDNIDSDDKFILKIHPFNSKAIETILRHGWTCPTDVLNFGTDNAGGDVTTYNSPGVASKAGNAAHEFGHLILISHSKNRSHLMYGGSGSASTSCWAQKNNKLICERAHPKVALRPHILWAEKQCELLTGQKIKWTGVLDK